MPPFALAITEQDRRTLECWTRSSTISASRVASANAVLGATRPDCPDRPASGLIGTMLPRPLPPPEPPVDASVAHGAWGRAAHRLRRAATAQARHYGCQVARR